MTFCDLIILPKIISKAFSHLIEIVTIPKFEIANFMKFNSPYWQILENSSRNFSESPVCRGVTQTDFWKTHPVFQNLNFRGMTWTNFGKIHPSFFVRTYSVSVKYRGMSLSDSWKTGPYLDEFSINRSSSCPGNLSISVILWSLPENS